MDFFKERNPIDSASFEDSDKIRAALLKNRDRKGFFAPEDLQSPSENENNAQAVNKQSEAAKANSELSQKSDSRTPRPASQGIHFLLFNPKASSTPKPDIDFMDIEEEQEQPAKTSKSSNKTKQDSSKMKLTNVESSASVRSAIPGRSKDASPATKKVLGMLRRCESSGLEVENSKKTESVQEGEVVTEKSPDRCEKRRATNDSNRSNQEKRKKSDSEEKTAVPKNMKQTKIQFPATKRTINKKPPLKRKGTPEVLELPRSRRLRNEPEMQVIASNSEDEGGKEPVVAVPGTSSALNQLNQNKNKIVRQNVEEEILEIQEDGELQDTIDQSSTSHKVQADISKDQQSRNDYSLDTEDAVDAILESENADVGRSQEPHNTQNPAKSSQKDRQGTSKDQKAPQGTSNYLQRRPNTRQNSRKMSQVQKSSTSDTSSQSSCHSERSKRKASKQNDAISDTVPTQPKRAKSSKKDKNSKKNSFVGDKLDRTVDSGEESHGSPEVVKLSSGKQSNSHSAGPSNRVQHEKSGSVSSGQSSSDHQSSSKQSSINKSHQKTPVDSESTTDEDEDLPKSKNRRVPKKTGTIGQQKARKAITKNLKSNQLRKPQQAVDASSNNSEDSDPFFLYNPDDHCPRKGLRIRRLQPHWMETARKHVAVQYRIPTSRDMRAEQETKEIMKTCRITERAIAPEPYDLFLAPQEKLKRAKAIKKEQESIPRNFVSGLRERVEVEKRLHTDFVNDVKNAKPVDEPPAEGVQYGKITSSSLVFQRSGDGVSIAQMGPENFMMKLDCGKRTEGSLKNASLLVTVMNGSIRITDNGKSSIVSSMESYNFANVNRYSFENTGNDIAIMMHHRTEK